MAPARLVGGELTRNYEWRRFGFESRTRPRPANAADALPRFVCV
jgi:hypothetical protein